MGSRVDSLGMSGIHRVCRLVFWGLGDHVRLARNVGEQATLHACVGAVVVQKQVHGG